jgi:hypothetical protein
MTAAKSTAARAAMESVRPMKQAGHFALHFAEMCAPMCIGFAVGDLVYFWVAELAGYSEPFRDLPYRPFWSSPSR